MNKIACILIGEIQGSKADQELSSQCSAPMPGEDTAKSAPTRKEK